MNTQQGLPQRLNYRGFVAPGVMELADGSFFYGVEYWGPDQEYANYVRMERLAEQFNNDIAKLKSGWVIQIEAIRVPIVLDATTNHCPEPTSQLMAEERAAAYRQEGAHFRTRLVLTLTWLPPLELGRKFSHYLFGAQPIKKERSRFVLLAMFQEQVKQLLDALGHDLKFIRLTDDEMTRFLHYCVTGEDRHVGQVAGKALHYAIGAATMEPWRGKIGKLHTRVVGVYGFPRGVLPQMLDDILQLPFSLRLSQRFMFVTGRKAIKELEKTQNKWGVPNWFNLKRLSLTATKNVVGADPNKKGVVKHNQDADNQYDSVGREITALQEGRVTGGYYTLVVVLQDEDEEVVEERAARVVEVLNHKGFTAVLETDNAPYAWQGSLPGHAANVRRPRLTTKHFTRLWPLSCPWRGHEQHPSPLYPPNSGPLLICKSTGSVPFAFTPRLHSLTIGPTGNGKTVLFGAMAMAHLQYENAQVNFFDHGAGAVIPTWTSGGEYFDLDAMKFAPLAHIDDPGETAWALRLLEKMAALRHFQMNTRAQEDLQRALQHLSGVGIEHRHITGLLGQLQTTEKGLETALGYYAGNQPGSVLDGKYSPLTDSHWLTFDMIEIMKRGPEISTPVLMTQVHLLDRKMDQRPTAMFFDESWIAIEDELFENYISRSTATARKQVVSLHLVLHSPGDLNNFKQKSRIINNIGTYVFLPNEMANTGSIRKDYSDMGLSSRVIKKIAEEMVSRRHYLVKEGNQMRVFELPWGRWHQVILGVNGPTYRDRALVLKKQYGHGMTEPWLQEQGHTDLAEQWARRYQQGRREAA